MKRESWLPVVPESAAQARAIVREVGARRALDGSLLWDLMAATSEAVANAVEHGGACGEHGSILLTIEWSDGEIAVAVCDCGRFTSALPSPDLDATSGRGIPIIAALMDRLEIEAAAGGTQVRFGKRLAAAA